MSESLLSYPLSEYGSKGKTDKCELKAPFILSFSDPEVDALVHRKFKNYVHEENANDAIIFHESLGQPSHIPEVSTFNTGDLHVITIWRFGMSLF